MYGLGPRLHYVHFFAKSIYCPFYIHRTPMSFFVAVVFFYLSNPLCQFYDAVIL